MLDDIRAELIREQEKAYLVIYDREQPKRMFTYATFLILVHGLMCWLVDQRIGLNNIMVRCLNLRIFKIISYVLVKIFNLMLR